MILFVATRRKHPGPAGADPPPVFQDLVEAEILYTAVFHDEKTIHYRYLRRSLQHPFESTFKDADAPKGLST